jgi:hypothetical protein
MNKPTAREQVLKMSEEELRAALLEIAWHYDNAETITIFDLASWFE